MMSAPNNDHVQSIFLASREQTFYASFLIADLDLLSLKIVDFGWFLKHSFLNI